MPTSDDEQDHEPVDAPAFTRLLSRPLSMLVFVAIVFVVTTVQAMANPFGAIVMGDFTWDYRLPLAVVVAVVVAGCAVQSALLLLSARAPVIAVLGTTVCYLGLMVGVDVPRWLTGMALVVAVAAFFLAVHRRAVTTIATTAAVIALACVVIFQYALGAGLPPSAAWGYTFADGLAFAAPVIGGAALGAWWAGRMRRLRRASAQVAAAAREHEAEVERAKALERARIAQELHDVAGQHLAGLLSLADAAVEIDLLDADQAATLIEEMRAEGRFASASLYAALRDLRAESGSQAEPTRDLRALDDLVAFWTDRGMSVIRRVHAPVDDLPAMVSTTAYRVVQEALTNVSKHAAGADAAIDVRVGPHAVRVSVSNTPGRTAVTGADPHGLRWGLTGLAERVELLHGTFQAGPAPHGDGWLVVMEAPVSIDEGAVRARRA
ncbi:histidine kinase [uncultured Microbacterium sp.]|uniref:sensor histidine kinase n=1 Tax=uncultured Microbacterium sp. TaxID=191216 RepID=UPI0025DEA76E|nr:histidine kinase [uncultured Microbacterium sp.]